DGHTLFTSSRNGTITRWDVQTRQQVGGVSSQDSSELTALALSPDGTFLITGHTDASIKRWQILPVK
ncbi:MAG: hypothetical protein ACYDAR_15310, partial [Thermomicrobiales bacterium]